MKTAKEILRTKGITEKSKNHVYDYLYKSTIEAMDMEFYNTFRTQFELLPRFTIIYGKDTLNGFAIEWLWFGVLLGIKRKIGLNALIILWMCKDFACDLLNDC